MELWVAFAFGALLGLSIGVLVGRHRAAAHHTGPTLPPPIPKPPPPPAVQHVVLDEGSANVLNALNNRLAAIGALADLLHGSQLDPERARALMMLHGEVRRAAEITQHFLELAQHPIGAAEPSDAAIVLNGVLAEREGTLKELGVKVARTIPPDLSMVACPMAQLTEMLMKLLDFALRRLRDHAPPRELRISITEAGPSVIISLWDSGAPLSVEAEQRLVTPFRFTQSAGGGEIEFALARALAQSAGGTLRLRPRSSEGAEVVVTLSKSVLTPLARATPSTPALPKLRILVVDDDAVNRQAMRLLLEREGHEVVAVENGLEAIERLGPASDRFDAVVTDLQMPRLGGRALYEQLQEQRPQL
ncbi:MAG TPA: hybrid sensor histidine kinase/response regulator, partial [Gemmatimonadales bacterium]|nr:hybrid sensor histidine kinase/response regulator [Gemmatimonadales bacterium]